MAQPVPCFDCEFCGKRFVGSHAKPEVDVHEQIPNPQRVFPDRTVLSLGATPLTDMNLQTRFLDWLLPYSHLPLIICGSDINQHHERFYWVKSEQVVKGRQKLQHATLMHALEKGYVRAVVPNAQLSPG